MKITVTIRPLPFNCPQNHFLKNLHNSELLLETKLPRQKEIANTRNLISFCLFANIQRQARILHTEKAIIKCS